MSRVKNILQFKRYLGLDWGTKRIGLAIGDSETKIAVPYSVADNLAAVLKVIQEEEIDEIVIGLPLAMKQSDNALQNNFVVFLEALKKKTSLPIKTIDERLSSKAADARGGDKKSKAPRDAVAAMIILEDYLLRN